jgi:hypothetical protein
MRVACGQMRSPDGVREPTSGHPRRSAALAILLLLAWTPGAASAADGDARPPTRLRLVRPAGPLAPGEEASLVIQTVGERNERLPAQKALLVTLSGAGPITTVTRVTIPAGSSEVSVPIRAAKTGVWVVEARGEGLYATSTVVACVGQALLQSHQARAARAGRFPGGGAAAPEEKQPPTVPTAPPPAATRRPTATAVTRPPTATAARSPAAMARTRAAPSRAASPALAGRAPAASPPPPPQELAAPAPPASPGARTEIERLRVAPPLTTLRRAAPSPAAAPAPPAEASAASAAPSRAPGASTAPEAGAGAPGPAGTGGTEGAGASASGAAGGGDGSGVRLIPERLERHRGAQGWESVAIDAYWYDKGNPGPAPRDVDLALVCEQGDLRIDPGRLSIPSGDFVSSHSATVTPAAAAKASLQALYMGGQSNRVEMSFLAAPAVRLSFSSGSQLIHAFGVVSSDVYVRLLDAAGEPAVADQPVKVSLQLIGPIGSPQLPPAMINANEIETYAPIELPRFGRYTVLASAPNLADAAPLTIEVAFDWPLLLATLLGGLLGSLTRVLYQGQGGAAAARWLLRVLLLGGLAALLVVLLSAFGLLSLVAGAFPESWAQALAKVPLGSLTGVFLLGYLAGLLFDRVFGRLLSPAGGRGEGAAAAPPPAASKG